MNVLESKLLNDSATTFWLKEQITQSKERDILDAINDAETLLLVLHNRFNSAVESKSADTLQHDQTA
jgi:hypothetical protein